MWRLSATASGDESVAEGTLTGPYWPRLPHNRSLKSRLSLVVGDPEATKPWQDLFGPMGHACPKVQCGVSVPPLPVKVSPRRYANWPVFGPRLPHNRSLKSRLSLGVGDPERRNLAGLVWPMGQACKSAMWRLSATASGESVAEGTLTGPYWPPLTP
ncbi:hypothetical protein DPMN_193679 [Dreissena polymorpha]|uniref:Uncharacterized protein n=1 Tax=Dreissena polymorpha TaxID=45954 RepID=A0A9D3XXP6_DREPO|nr:hypothetical protein DPMN_193679 [Dreissena polymorpha]